MAKPAHRGSGVGLRLNSEVEATIIPPMRRPPQVLKRRTSLSSPAILSAASSELHRCRRGNSRIAGATGPSPVATAVEEYDWLVIRASCPAWQVSDRTPTSDVERHIPRYGATLRNETLRKVVGQVDARSGVANDFDGR